MIFSINAQGYGWGNVLGLVKGKGVINRVLGVGEDRDGKC